MSRLDVPVPSRARELAGLPKIDYADAWTIDVTGQRSPREWLQIAIEGNSTVFSAVRVAHRALGIRLAPAGLADHPLGWTILLDDARELVLSATGSLGEGRLVGISTPIGLTLATLLQLKGRLSGALWFGAGVHGHRILGPLILADLPRLGAARQPGN